MLESLTAQHSFERGWGTTFKMQPDGEDQLHKLKKAFPLMTHPETGRTALDFNEFYTSRIYE